VYLVNVEVPSHSPAAGRQIVDIGFPRDALIVLIGRGDSFIVAKGGSIVQPNDRLLVLADKERSHMSHQKRVSIRAGLAYRRRIWLRIGPVRRRRLHRWAVLLIRRQRD